MKHMYIINAAVFSVVALIHGWRAVANTPVVIDSFAMPLWLSAVAFFVAGLLAFFNGRVHGPFTKKDTALFVLTLFVIDMCAVLFYWSYGLSFWGVSGMGYALVAVFDAVVIALLIRYRMHD
ncbi:hypothetical protein A3C87_01965 [Candidatus Kaiserbacteria bacterium RIFCSPHIGHO2_02_FULL_49_34]|uniref:Uncharacterized protein n=1 Tax=Candidatus Kaiserbacteria bacterium RIFCSPHIGHO2_02_FULL_49_34 TaxID=1798491 RepID=A0A1F6DI09_9BACT|nr:MAG: hypothetical protein A3C87_01965 [Candidatus Kaiserbacteria bacterium RIFCSPHIGHO2_02_FULL_49_34]